MIAAILKNETEPEKASNVLTALVADKLIPPTNINDTNFYLSNIN